MSLGLFIPGKQMMTRCPSSGSDDQVRAIVPPSGSVTNSCRTRDARFGSLTYPKKPAVCAFHASMFGTYVRSSIGMSRRRASFSAVGE